MLCKLTIQPKKILDLENLHLSTDNKKKIEQLIEEYTYYEVLAKYNLPIDNKILLYGATGCGKTATAYAIAKHLEKEIIILNLGAFVSSKLGETAKNVSEIFEQANLKDAVLFIDEFDFIAKSRGADSKDNGEMKRVVNALLQQIDNLKDNSILIAATNYLDIIDNAIKRRFQLRLQYDLPNVKELNSYYKSFLAQYPSEIIKVKKKYGISYAQARDYMLQCVKKNLIKKERLK